MLITLKEYHQYNIGTVNFLDAITLFLVEELKKFTIYRSVISKKSLTLLLKIHI